MIMVPSSFKNDYMKYQRQLVYDLSREIILGLDSELTEECPNCFFDQSTQVSSAVRNTDFTGTKTIFEGTPYAVTVTATDFRHTCPICRGKGIFSVPNEKTIMAHVVWELRQDEPASPAGDAAQDKISIKAHSKYYNDFLQAKYFLVDGRKLLVKDYPISRGMGSSTGIVEVLCVTSDSSKEIL
jgi:hypothetical protein